MNSTATTTRLKNTTVAPSHQVPAPSGKTETLLPLFGTKVCHLTPVQNRRDERAFTRESLPLIRYGLRPVIVGAQPLEGDLEGVSFVRMPAKRNRLVRILFALRIVVWALRQDADIYHLHSPELIPAALILKFIFHKKVVYDSREDFPAMMLTKTYLPPRWRVFFSRMVAATERLAARTLDGVITADPGSLRPLAKIGSSGKLVLYNFPNLRYFPPKAAQERKYDLVYRGGLSERAGTFVLLRAVRILLDSGLNVRVLLFGYSDNEQSARAIRDALNALGISHLITLAGVIPHDDMAATLSRARIMVCPLQSIPKFLNNIPVKIFEAWACGLPVIATDLPPIRPFMRDRDYGRLVKPGDAAALAEAIRTLLASPELIEEYGRRARQAVLNRYNNSQEACKLVKFYGRVLA